MIPNKLLPWQIAAARRTFVFWATLPFLASEEFWKTWQSVMFPEGK